MSASVHILFSYRCLFSNEDKKFHLLSQFFQYLAVVAFLAK